VRFGKETEEGMVIEVPLRHQDIASSINASRETASREIAVLERKKLIENKRFYIVLKDIPAMQAML
jgi:CRP-like cAMP-binding protein